MKPRPARKTGQVHLSMQRVRILLQLSTLNTQHSTLNSQPLRISFLFREKSGELRKPWRYSATFCRQTTEEKL